MMFRARCLTVLTLASALVPSSGDNLGSLDLSKKIGDDTEIVQVQLTMATEPQYSFPEGTVDFAESYGETFSAEDESKAACQLSDTCKGYMMYDSGAFRLLGAGYLTYSKTGLADVSSVKVKTNSASQSLYTEGTVEKGSSFGEGFRTVIAAEGACDADAKCKGYLMYQDGDFRLVGDGQLRYSRPITFSDVLSVKVKNSKQAASDAIDDFFTECLENEKLANFTEQNKRCFCDKVDFGVAGIRGLETGCDDEAVATDAQQVATNLTNRTDDAGA